MLWCVLFGFGVLAVVGTAIAAVVAGASGHVPGWVPLVVFVALTPVHVGFVCAMLYGRAGSWARITSLVSASLMAAICFLAIARAPGNVLTFGLTGSIVVLLSLTKSGDWFRRPRV